MGTTDGITSMKATNKLKEEILGDLERYESILREARFWRSTEKIAEHEEALANTTPQKISVTIDHRFEQIAEEVADGVQAEAAHQSTYEPAADNNSAVPQPPSTPLIVRKHIAKVADKSDCGRKTREENSEALVWVTYWRATSQKSKEDTEKEIAENLKQAGASNAVIGYLMAPESENLRGLSSQSAGKRIQRLLHK